MRLLNLKMKLFNILFLFVCLGCNTQTRHPKGGFDYPKSISDKDSNLYYYPLKDIEDKKTAFNDSYAYLFYQLFDEPNLSLKPLQNETIRLTYSDAFGSSAIVTLSKKSIIVKTGNPFEVYYDDTTKLSDIEKHHYFLLQRRYPIDTAGKNQYLKRYLDSMIKLYPQLLDPKYYHELADKTIPRNRKRLAYQLTTQKLTNEEYNMLIRKLDSSGFWTMPNKIGCNKTIADGFGFKLEMNTKEKYNIVRIAGCPGDTSKFTKACQLLIDYAKTDKEINLIWDDKIEPVD